MDGIRDVSEGNSSPESEQGETIVQHSKRDLIGQSDVDTQPNKRLRPEL